MATIQYELPELDYEYSDLQPVISEEIMTLHHSKHHQGYVNKANAGLKALEEARESGEDLDYKGVMKNLSFNLNGHLMHEVFWKNLRPQSDGNAPDGELETHLNKQFGSVKSFMKEFGAAAKGVEGSGWASLVRDEERNLFVTQVENHNKLHYVGLTPVLVIDVWEHAYYLDYKNNRGDYVDAFWSIVNWEDVAQRVLA